MDNSGMLNIKLIIAGGLRRFSFIVLIFMPIAVIAFVSQEMPGYCENNKSWLYEGPIYETHPYYYPNHSFKEITQAVPNLADLGIKTIYLMPVWESTRWAGNQNIPFKFLYWINDYYKINPEYGTQEELKELVACAHRYNMRIVFDLVTCCTFEGSATYKWNFTVPLAELKTLKAPLRYSVVKGMNCAYSKPKKDKHSPKMKYLDLFGKIDGNIAHLYIYPYPFFGPAMDKANPEAIDYFTKVAEYYVREFDIDGFRVDAPANNWNPALIRGDHSIINLLRSVKKAINGVKPDAVLFAETPFVDNTWTIKGGSPETFLEPVLDQMCEASYSYDFVRGLGRRKNSQALVEWFARERINNNRTRIRFLETHDSPRINALAPAVNKCLFVLVSTVPGIPMIQAGQEIGATNEWFSYWYSVKKIKPDPRVDWDKRDHRLRGFYKKIFSVRDMNPALKYGDIKNVWKSGDNIYAYSRTYDDETVVVVINFRSKITSSVLNLPFNPGIVLYDELNDESFIVDNPDVFRLSVAAYGSRILVLKDKNQKTD